MPKRDQDQETPTQRIFIGARPTAEAPGHNRSMETQKIATVKKTDLPRSQETMRVTPSEAIGVLFVSLSPQELKSLPYGTLKLDEAGTILRYNPFANPDGPDPAALQGKNFFTDGTPFEAITSFYGRFLEGVAARELYAEFKFHIVCEGTKPSDLQITLYHSKSSDSFWALLNRAASS